MNPVIRSESHEQRRARLSRLRAMLPREARADIAAEFAMVAEVQLIAMRALTAPLAELIGEPR